MMNFFVFSVLFAFGFVSLPSSVALSRDSSSSAAAAQDPLKLILGFFPLCFFLCFTFSFLDLFLLLRSLECHLGFWVYLVESKALIFLKFPIICDLLFSVGSSSCECFQCYVSKSLSLARLSIKA